MLKKEKIPHHEEGTPESGWILLDAFDVIVHIFGVEERALYKLEDLWNTAPTRVRIP
jgi:ribosome-associated protein